MDASLVSGGRRWGKIVALMFIASLLQFFPQTGAACVSSCGRITNITSPFRLKGDPDHCGDKKYELECVDDVVVLRILSAEFYVLSINYHNSTIRLVDPNFHDSSSSDCSSLPRHFLYPFNFSDYNTNHQNFDNRFQAPQYQVIYMKCEKAVRDNPYYVDTTPCLDQQIYAVPGDISLADLTIECRAIATTPSSSLNYSDFLNLSYVDIHRQLKAFGFEVSWLPPSCKRFYTSSPLCYSEYYDGNSRGGELISIPRSNHKIADWLAKHEYSRMSPKAILHGILTGIYFAATHRSRSELMFIDHPLHPQFYEAIYYGWYGLISLVAVRVLFGVTFLPALIISKWRKRHLSIYDNIEHFLQNNDPMPIRYSYKEIKKMTRGFKDKLGEGGYGTVYKGKLRSGPYVAIKMLNKSKANGQEFISEVMTIGRIHHVHVVHLIGFCVEGSKRALVYDFMANGSLDKFIFSEEESASLSYEKIYEISLGVARGIAYLHHGCDVQILHFDIKPHNILLDDNYIPKVSDFGLAKLYSREDSSVTLTDARGTIGYIAPELFYQNIGGVSYKADVYSFGMLLMEMTNKRRNLNLQAEHSSQLYFPLWIYDHFNEEIDIEMEALTREEKDLTKKMFIVALWCIQLKPVDRPSMIKVVEMLEADVESLQMPLKPLLYPHETIAQSHGSNSEQASCKDSITSFSYVSDDVPESSTSREGK